MEKHAKKNAKQAKDLENMDKILASQGSADDSFSGGSKGGKDEDNVDNM